MLWQANSSFLPCPSHPICLKLAGLSSTQTRRTAVLQSVMTISHSGKQMNGKTDSTILLSQIVVNKTPNSLWHAVRVSTHGRRTSTHRPTSRRTTETTWTFRHLRLQQSTLSVSQRIPRG